MEIKFTVLGLLIYSAMAAYLLGFILAVSKKVKAGKSVYFIGFVLAVAAFVYRWVTGHHVPMQNLFEVFLTLGMLTYPLTALSRKYLRIGGGRGGCADMLIGFIVLFPAGFVFDAELRLLPPALQCWLFVPHVATYMLSYMIMAKAAILALGQVISSTDYRDKWSFKATLSSILTLIVMAYPAILILVKKLLPAINTLRSEEQIAPEMTQAAIFNLILYLIILISSLVFVWAIMYIFSKPIYKFIVWLHNLFAEEPSSENNLLSYEESTYRMICVGFPFLTLGLILGSWWGKLAWGDYWGWDPKELWSLISWLMFLIYFHFRAMYGKKYSRTNSTLAILGMAAIIITLLWVNLAKIFSGGLHSYA